MNNKNENGKSRMVAADVLRCVACYLVISIHFLMNSGFYSTTVYGKKMFLAVGRRVLRLKRVRIGGLELDKTLKEGECRELTKEELALIFQGENRRFCEKKNSNGQI